MLAMKIIATVLLTIRLLYGWYYLTAYDFDSPGASIGIGTIFIIVTVWIT